MINSNTQLYPRRKQKLILFIRNFSTMKFVFIRLVSHKSHAYPNVECAEQLLLFSLCEFRCFFKLQIGMGLMKTRIPLNV